MPLPEVSPEEGNLHNRNFALILAAGLSTRMGTCKTTLPWHNNQTLLRYQAEQFLLAGITPIIVLGSHNAHRQSDCPDGSRIVINYHCDRGKTSSILTGLQALPPDFATIIISAVDQPRSANIYQTLLRVYQQEQSLIIAPVYCGKLGHPLLFSSKLLPDLKKITDANLGLREIKQKFDYFINKIEFSSPEVLTDLNYRNLYLAAKKDDQLTLIVSNS